MEVAKQQVLGVSLPYLHATDDILLSAIRNLKNENIPYYKIVGDNVDMEIRARVQDKQHTNRSVHWTHQFAIKDKIVDHNLDTTNSAKPSKSLQLADLLPSQAVMTRLKSRWAVLVSRVVVTYLEKFNGLKSFVVKHIEHKYSKEMKAKSDTCCLGMEFKNPNIAGEMAQIMIANQDRYVPSFDCNVAPPSLPNHENPDLLAKAKKKEVLITVGFQGDQLFEERARNVQWTFRVGNNKYDRLEGLSTEFADWHAKVTLYKSEYDMFVKNESAAEVGTTRASMNRTHKTNAAKGIDKGYNEYKEFHEREIEAHICAAFMEMAKMANLKDEPLLILPDVSLSSNIKKKWLLDICEGLIDNCIARSGDINRLVNQTIDFSPVSNKGPFACRHSECSNEYVYHSNRVRHEIDAHGVQYNTAMPGSEKDDHGYYNCQYGCGYVFSTKSSQNRHQRLKHNSPVRAAPEQHEHGNREEKENDYLFNYHNSKLLFGLVLMEFNDSVKEGDGERLFDLYKFCLLLYKCGGHRKYSYVVLLHLAKLTYLLSPFEAHRLKWNRFFNKNGGNGKNIPLDLRKEQLNKVLKTMWRSLGSNIDENNASRVANRLEVMEQTLDSIDKDCQYTQRKGKRNIQNQGVAVAQISSDLMQKNVFRYTPGREGHASFPKFEGDLFKGIDYKDLHTWMREHIELWASIYEK